MKITKEQLSSEVSRFVNNYREMRKGGSSLYEDAMWQYADMAKGGDGGDLGFKERGETTCRGINYPGYPDRFFQEVCDLMMWDR